MAVSYTWQLVSDAPVSTATTQEAVAGEALPRDIKLNATGDGFELAGGDLVLTTGGEALAQDIALSLALIRGEYFADLDAGVPYFEDFWVKNPNLAVVRADIRECIEARPGVKSVEQLELVVDKASRRADITFNVISDFGLLAMTVSQGGA
jgi:hypothetical protein